MHFKHNFNWKARQSLSLPVQAIILIAGTFGLINVKGGQWSLSQFSPLAPALFYNWDSTDLPNIPGLTWNPYPYEVGELAPNNIRSAGLAPEALENVSAYSYLDIKFNPPVQAVGGYPFALEVPNTITEIVYDKNTNVIESASVSLPADVYPYDVPVTFLGIGETTTNIYKVEWQYSTPNFFGVANIIYQPGPSMILANTVSSSTNFAFQYQSLAGHTNYIQTSTNVASGNWTTLTNFTLFGDGMMKQITIPTTNLPAGYFRVQAY